MSLYGLHSDYSGHQSSQRAVTVRGVIMEEFINVGKRIPKMDAEEKVTGKAIYIHDLKIPGMLHGKILYSSHPHAKIKSIDTSKAESLPG